MIDRRMILSMHSVMRREADVNSTVESRVSLAVNESPVVNTTDRRNSICGYQCMTGGGKELSYNTSGDHE